MTCAAEILLLVQFICADIYTDRPCPDVFYALEKSVSSYEKAMTEERYCAVVERLEGE